jgi:hypothetical protein
LLPRRHNLRADRPAQRSDTIDPMVGRIKSASVVLKNALPKAMPDQINMESGAGAEQGGKRRP